MQQTIEQLRAMFPQLLRSVNGQPLHYLDSAATALTPQSVIESMTTYYRDNSTTYGGIHTLSSETTLAVNEARHTVRKFINARRDDEIVFTKGATESINLIASTFGRQKLQTGGHIVVTALEHHANFVPWQQLALETKSKFTVAPLLQNGSLDVAALKNILDTGDVTILAITHASNTTGEIIPVKEIIRRAHKHGAAVVVDGTQAVVHLPVDVESLDADFYVFSGHKLYGPTGIGVAYGKRELWADLPPYQTGGKMIANVTVEQTTFAKPPYRFEAGTLNIAGILGLQAAIQFVTKLPNSAIEHERMLLKDAQAKLQSISNIHCLIPDGETLPLISFHMTGIHPHDIGTIANEHGVAIRTGHLCTEPLLQSIGIPAVARASFAIYNTTDDIDALVESIKHARKILV